MVWRTNKEVTTPALLSRDRKGADIGVRAERRRPPWVRPAPRRHTGSLAAHPDPSRAIACFPGAPSAFARIHRGLTGQTSAGIRLEIVHNLFGAYLSFHDCVHTIGPHMGGQEAPTTVRTDF